MSNQSWPGVSSLVLNEPLLWEKGRPGRVGVSLPESDVPAAPYEAEGMVRTDLNLPVVRVLIPGLELTAEWDSFSRPSLRLFARYAAMYK